jgi:pimeloyl-ACP methyl ester carboxylesterase
MKPTTRGNDAVVQVRRNDLVFDVGVHGPPTGDPVLLLHGFPEVSDCWDGVATRLAAAGYRSLAPDQRGYSPGARPKGRRAYRLDELVNDALAFIDAAGAPVHLVGHDWGGIVAWHLASAHPERLRSLTVLSTPHPRAFARSLVTSFQGARSWYIGLFQLPAVPERLYLARDGALLRSMLTRTGLPPGPAHRYTERLMDPGALTAALNWYRALRLSSATSAGPIEVPTLYIWSTHDVALGPAAAGATRRWVRAPYRFERLDGRSHWLPEEAPAEVSALIIDHIQTAAKPV